MHRLTAEGRGAETVYRDGASGKIVGKDEFMESRQRGKKKPEKTKEELEEEQVCLLVQSKTLQKALHWPADQSSCCICKQVLEA